MQRHNSYYLLIIDCSRARETLKRIKNIKIIDQHITLISYFVDIIVIGVISLRGE